MSEGWTQTQANIFFLSQNICVFWCNHTGTNYWYPNTCSIYGSEACRCQLRAESHPGHFTAHIETRNQSYSHSHEALELERFYRPSAVVNFIIYTCAAPPAAAADVLWGNWPSAPSQCTLCWGGRDGLCFCWFISCLLAAATPEWSRGVRYSANQRRHLSRAVAGTAETIAGTDFLLLWKRKTF